MSLAGHYLNRKFIQDNELKEEDLFEIFRDPECLIQFSDYARNPTELLGNKDLVVCIKDQIYQYSDAIQIIVAK